MERNTCTTQEITHVFTQIISENISLNEPEIPLWCFNMFLFLFLLRIISSSKGYSPKRHPYTRASILCQWLQSDTGKRMMSSPPASPLPKYGRNRIRAGRRTKTQPKREIRANVCLVRHPCHNLAYDTKTVNTYREPSPFKRYQAQPKY